jgi:hypothetical protein
MKRYSAHKRTMAAKTIIQGTSGIKMAHPTVKSTSRETLIAINGKSPTDRF